MVWLSQMFTSSLQVLLTYGSTELGYWTKIASLASVREVGRECRIVSRLSELKVRIEGCLPPLFSTWNVKGGGGKITPKWIWEAADFLASQFCFRNNLSRVFSTKGIFQLQKLNLLKPVAAGVSKFYKSSHTLQSHSFPTSPPQTTWTCSAPVLPMESLLSAMIIKWKSMLWCSWLLNTIGWALTWKILWLLCPAFKLPRGIGQASSPCFETEC